jgi:diguanylate cyclase (GGDEF)-like protein/PAS domain S-box-containing protein
VFPSGELIWVHTKGRVVQRSAMGAAEQGVGTSLNITERKRAELAVRKEIALRKQMMEALPGVFYMLDQSGRFQTWNRNLEKVTQRDEHALAQMGALDLFAPEEKELVASKIRHTFETGVGNVEARLVAKDGSSTPYFLTGLALQIDGAPALIGIGADISELKAAQARIDQLAHFDHLTGLPNRSLLHDRIRYCLGIAQRNQQKLALFFFDLDHFKHVNDSLGHSMGDRLLIEIALRLKTSIRQQDTVARLGGDEFVLVLPDTDAEEAARVAEKLLSVVSQPYYIDGHELVATPSIGIAMYPENGEDFETLSQCADVAMYRTKRSGRNGYCFFVPEMQVNASRYLALASALRHALELGQLSVYYQPQVSIYSNKVIGVEALLRWHHPEFGDISPTEFIPIAEDCGLIAAIGAWTLRTAVRQLKQWIDSGMRAIVMAVNLSSLQFRNDRLPELVAQILSEEGVPAHYLELELTEGAAMDNPVAAMSMMNKLRERGVRIAIDDFGMGHSSLGHLKRFELNRLKIDKSFVMNITVDLEDKAIVRAIISMANSLNIQVIAEGVETLEQFAYLREQGCHEVQGDYFCPAVPAEQVELFMRNFRGRGVAQAAGSLV